MPLRLKTARFYKDVQSRLKSEGLVVFNLNRHQTVAEDINTIRSAFPQIYIFRVSNTNVVVVGSLAEARVPVSVLKARGRELNRRFKANFSFSGLVRRLAG